MELGKRSWGDEQVFDRVRVSRLQLHKGYMKLEPAGGPEQELPLVKRSSVLSLGQEYQRRQQQRQHQQKRRKWRFRIRPKVKVLYSTISRLVRRLRDSYARVMLALAASARESSLLSLGVSKKKPRTAIGNGSIFRYGSGAGSNFNEVETKYMDYIKRSVTDGELAYYTTSLRSSGIL
ncbi:unnamed protein product [Calypogeia fissa]